MNSFSGRADSHPFPYRFVWGAATSAYQIEGSPLADGAGPSTWHRFTHTPGRVLTGETGDVACDHYRRRRGDIALMRELGLGAYRLGVPWGRGRPGRTSRVQRAPSNLIWSLFSTAGPTGVRATEAGMSTISPPVSRFTTRAAHG